ncbi:unnamed protein product [Dicrocoelium dendriticum]|nr:unnamed protein product [Dicrocoelium dendriticum]
MWDDICPAFLSFFVLLTDSVTYSVMEDSPLSCNWTDPSDAVATVLLTASSPYISSVDLRNCPNASRLDILGTPGTTYTLSSAFLSDVVISALTHLLIRVEHLLIEKKWAIPNHPSRIRHFVLSNCGISVIPMGTFYGLKELIHLDLSENQLTSVPSDLLLYSPVLSILNMSNNRLTFLPKLAFHGRLENPRTIDVSNNPIKCTCPNFALANEENFIGLPPCASEKTNCDASMSINLTLELKNLINGTIAGTYTGQTISFRCTITSHLHFSFFWVSPVGVVYLNQSVSNSLVNHTYSYIVQPLLAPTTFHIYFSNPSTSILEVNNVRGHLSGDWHCGGRSGVDMVLSKPIRLRVLSSMHHANVYLVSLCYGYGAMLVILLTGILGGTIRYCYETRCLRRPQPPFAYGGKTFIGVIPVPEVDVEYTVRRVNTKKPTYGIAEGSVQYISSGRVCAICLKPPTYWFCTTCRAVHFAEEVRCFSEATCRATADEIPVGDLLPDGEIRIDFASGATKLSLLDTSLKDYLGKTPESLFLKACSPTEPPLEHAGDDDPKDDVNVARAPRNLMYIFIRSGSCIVRIRNISPRFDSVDQVLDPDDVLQHMEAICCHTKQRPNSADVKLVVSNEKLAEEYRDALADLARAVDSPDPAHFREHLEEFRSRLRRDVGHGVKVLRGEFSDLRAKSARGVANLRNQSTAAAQKMRAGFSHGVEQVKEGMRSMVELCGASGTIGQTISIVSVYVDETDQTKKERLVSDFVF